MTDAERDHLRPFVASTLGLNPREDMRSSESNDEIERIIDAGLETFEKPRPIPVSDPPDEEEPVLLYALKRGRADRPENWHWIEGSLQSICGNVWCDYDKTNLDVTHWLPLPPEPEDET